MTARSWLVPLAILLASGLVAAQRPLPQGTYIPFVETTAVFDATMLTSIGGQDYVFAATQMDQGVWAFRLAGPPEARTLEPVSTFAMGLNGPSGPHDQAAGQRPPSPQT